jgi:addiction module RelB/DinJ family antitoxin
MSRFYSFCLTQNLDFYDFQEFFAHFLGAGTFSAASVHIDPSPRMRIDNVSVLAYIVSILMIRGVIMAQLSIRIDDKLKAEGEQLFKSLGLNYSSAFSLFVTQAVRERGIPFHITENANRNSRKLRSMPHGDVSEFLADNNDPEEDAYLRLTAKPNDSKAYSFVPVQDFGKSWTDDELFLKYGLSIDEIELIEKSVKPMDIGGGERE